MSSISFATKTKEAYLRGSERAYMSRICNNIALAAFAPYDLPSTPCWTRALLPPNHYLHRCDSSQYADAFRAWISTSFSGNVIHPKTRESLDTFGVVLNTVLRLGSDEVRLMARLHGQCEIHAYIPPSETEFIARLIDRGLQSQLYRPKMGWDEVAALLREACRMGETVVTSYSVCETFPGWDHEKDEAMDWDTALAALDPLLELCSVGWVDYEFNEGLTAMSLRKLAQEVSLP